MDAATAAAMSDPDRNPMFSRRWDECDLPVVPRPQPPLAEPAGNLDGIALLHAWRQQRSSAVRSTP